MNTMKWRKTRMQRKERRKDMRNEGEEEEDK